LRASQLLLPTVKEDPAGAEAASHKLMVRAGLIRQLAAGVYVFLPAGWRVMRKIEAVIREEMEAIGCQEMLYPVINPAEIWQQSGRWQSIGDELFRLKDRKGTDMVLAMTHEEVVTWLAAREIHSYKQLPQLWFHMQTKERDEARPKSGLLRVREFIMKDSYSLDTDFDAMQVSYDKHIAAYDRIFARCGVSIRRVLSDPGMMGGSIAHEYMAPSEAGEDEIVFCEQCGYAANVELAVAGPEHAGGAAAGHGGGEEGPREIHTPDQRTIADVAAFLAVEPRELMKSLVVVSEERGPLLVLVRGDHDLHEGKLRRIVGEFRMATPDEVAAAQGVQPGFVGPVGTRLPVLGDEALRGGVFTGGANKPDHHLAGIAADEVVGEYHDLRVVHGGDPCPECGKALAGERVIEVGNIFQLGTKYSKPMAATYLDEQGVARDIVMGSYGIGLARVAAAAVEQHHDEHGICWPAAIAPFQVHVLVVRATDPVQAALAEEIYAALGARGVEALFDDRELSPGVKFKDADLLGCPVQVVVGKRAAERVAELKPRASGERRDVAFADLPAAVTAALAAS
jgi:prolyl-tRNA synthetase